MRAGSLTQRNFANSAFLIRIVVVILVLPIVYSTWHRQNHGQKASSTPAAPVASYTGCVTNSGSTIQQSFPKVCVTAAGIRFTQEASAASSPSASASAAASASPSSNYVVIKEWGVRAKYSGNLT